MITLRRASFVLRVRVLILEQKFIQEERKGLIELYDAGGKDRDLVITMIEQKEEEI